jgi:predicted methyltransferase
MKFRVLAAMTAALGVLTVSSGYAAHHEKHDKAIEAAVAGNWRKADDKARDADRHPVEALTFWGLKPKATILEVQPGGGWWTEILAPYAKATGGEFHATAADLGDPGLSENARKGRDTFASRFANQDVYGKVNLVNWGPKAAPLPANKFDFVLAARVFHGWANNGSVDANLKKLYDSLKPGGVLAIEQHRGKPDQKDTVSGGYVAEQTVIDAATKAGFKLDARSEINANPKDTKDHPFGVWTLPPTRQSSPNAQTPVEPTFDRAKYDAIGESDRMTLRFIKPKN